MIVNDMLDLREFHCWLDDHLGNDLWITDPERKARIEEYAKQGLDGSTHQEVINDWREFAETYYPDDAELLENIDYSEERHIMNETINNIIGD